jgi:putative nucleotidyltransferase with HDIG domain
LSKLPRRVVTFRALLLLAAVSGAMLWLKSAPVMPWRDVLIFLAVALGADLVAVTLPQGGEVTAATAVAVAVALLFPPGTAMAIMVAAGVVAVLARVVTGSSGRAGVRLAMRTVALSVSLPVLAPGRPTGLAIVDVELMSRNGLNATIFVVVFCVVSLLLDQSELALSHRTGFRSVVSGVFTMVAPIYAALGALGALAAVVYPSMGVWAVLLLVGLLAVVRQSFSLYTAQRVNYRDTVRALAEAIEAQDHEAPGHAGRTAELALALGRELGMHGRELEDLSYAALLHDIGKLAAPEDSLDVLMDQLPPEEGGGRFHAERGAEILQQVEYLRHTADLVRFHHHPCAENVGQRQELPPGARVIAVASRFDKLTHWSGELPALGEHAAVTRIKSEEGSLFDPAVVRALARHLERTTFNL